jgi:hypothetical protein
MASVSLLQSASASKGGFTLDINELINRTRKSNNRITKEAKEQDAKFDKLLSKQVSPERIDEDEWHFEHDDLDCIKCSDNGEDHPLSFYLGTHKGEEAHKYECTNCGYVSIKTVSELHDELDEKEMKE